MCFHPQACLRIQQPDDTAVPLNDIDLHLRNDSYTLTAKSTQTEVKPVDYKDYYVCRNLTKQIAVADVVDLVLSATIDGWAAAEAVLAVSFCFIL